MNNLLQHILQDKTLLLICALILSTLSNLIYTVKENNTKRISKKTMETIYNTEIEKAHNAGTSEERKYHLDRASGIWEIYTQMGFEPKVYEDDHIKL